MVRTLVNLNHGQAAFHGTFTGGNGRGTPGPGATYDVQRPGRLAELVGRFHHHRRFERAVLRVLGRPQRRSRLEQTNQRIDSDGNVTMLPAVQLSQVNPQAGCWQFVFAVFGPIAGTSTSTSFVGGSRRRPAPVHTNGCAGQRVDKLAAGNSVSAIGVVHQRRRGSGELFVDSRGDTNRRCRSSCRTTRTSFGLDILPPFPAIGVPTETDSLTVSSMSSVPTLFEISPFPADHVTDLSFEGDPDVEAGPASTHPSVTLSDPIVAPQTWLALPAQHRPLRRRGQPDGHEHFTATAHTRRSTRR